MNCTRADGAALRIILAWHIAHTRTRARCAARHARGACFQKRDVAWRAQIGGDNGDASGRAHSQRDKSRPRERARSSIAQRGGGGNSGDDNTCGHRHTEGWPVGPR